MASLTHAAIRFGLLSLFAAFVPAPSLGNPIEIGERTLLRSEVLGEDRRLLVYRPHGYDTSTFRYPVLYLLDADSDFLHTIGIVEFLSRTDQIPEMIVIGVTNTVRSRDLTPPSGDTEETAFWPAVGGADRFLEFFRTELIPFVDESFRTEPYRILRGQSFGGLFAIHDYMSPTPTFDAYLTSSPAVGWNFDELIERAPSFFGAGVSRPLYIGAAGRDFPGNLSDIQKFAHIVGETQPNVGTWRYELFESESHYSLVHRSTYDALTFLYEDWQIPDDIASRAVFDDYVTHYARLSETYGYEIKIPMRSVIRLGNQLLRERRFPEGLAVLERNIELYPDQPESYWHVGDAHILSGEPHAAMPFLQIALDKAQAMGVPDVDDYRVSLEELEETLRESPN